MNKTLLMTIVTMMTASCLTLPDKPTCFADVYDANGLPVHGKCVYPEAGNDFEIDNTGKNQYTLDGHNWTIVELQHNSFITPPETVSADDQFFLAFCHENPSDCETDSTSNVDSQVDDYESRMEKLDPQ